MTENGKSDSEPRSSVMKLLPALFALVLIAALVIIWQMRKPIQSANPDVPKSAAAAPPAQPTGPATPPPTVQAGAPAAKVPAGEEGDHKDVKPYPVENVPPPEPPPNLTPAEREKKAKETAEWLAKNKKPDLTKDEKVERASGAMKNLQLATADLEKQIQDAETAGNKQEAAEKRIRLQRLKSRLDAIDKAVKEGRDPSGGVDELSH